MFLVPSLELLETSYDIATLSFIFSLLLLSLVSLSFIFYLRFKSRTCHPLQNFSALWTIRLLLVSFTSLWALTELLRLPFFRRNHLRPFLSPLAVPQQANICKLHLVLSLGLFEPGFLITLLLLVNLCIKKRTGDDGRAVGSVLLLCLPVLLLQIFFVWFPKEDHPLPESFLETFEVFRDGSGLETVFCAYPLACTLVFGAFVVAYLVFFLMSFGRMVSTVINKGLRVRIYVLAFSIVISLPLQILFLGIAALWQSNEAVYGGVALVAFLSVMSCAVVGEGILVIKPIADALAASRKQYEGCSGERWGPTVGFV